MADKLVLVITLRKEVPDIATGKTILALVRSRLEDNPNIIITGHVTNNLATEEVPP